MTAGGWRSPRPLLLLLAACLQPLSDCLFVTDYFTRTPRKLNAFTSFTSAELFHFHVPEDTVVAIWNLITFKEQGGSFGDSCPDRDITVYFRPGAPPVINPLHTRFPGDTVVPGSFAVTLTWSLPNRTTGAFNITSPLPGDWFLAAHLPKDTGKISVKGLYEECQYLFQPQLIVQRLVGIPVLFPGYLMDQVIPARNKSSLYKVFVPSYTSRVTVQLSECSCSNATLRGCPVLLKLRAKAPPLHNSSRVDCAGLHGCQLQQAAPFWQQWYYILVERTVRDVTISFQVGVRIQECSKPASSGSVEAEITPALNMPQSFGAPGSPSILEALPVVGLSPRQLNVSGLGGAGGGGEGEGEGAAGERCWPVRPTLRNELDTFSVHFYIFFGPNISVPPSGQAVFAINLMPVLDSGGVLNMELKLNTTSLKGENATVVGCLNHGVPMTSSNNTSTSCKSERSAGFALLVNASSNITRLHIPYPQTGTWYISLRTLCAVGHGFEECSNVTAEVYLRMFTTPCINECGTYGQCKLLRTNNYLYAACECKAGWDGWGCTDNMEAYSYSFQLLSTLLLCLSNLMFVPPVAIAIRGNYLLEASVYIFTMFFSTFYHACDQPGIVVFCIMDYDVLQFCDFLGSLMSVWVTVIAMARLQPVLKQILYLLGAMLLSMALQLDRHGLWNLLGPSLFALGVMAIAWTVRAISRRHCYPPTWKRWVFYLFPGTVIATSAVALYAFVETEGNYFYIHSIWHMLIAGSVGFLLPPSTGSQRGGVGAPRAAGAVPLPKKRSCGYRLCINEHEEMGLVDPGLVSVNSVCSS
ncbi:transmembrane protein 8B [Leucoraja erinacea]|uniref:transmembrane protein 8B n=1 Tax=Leucoraja erinaceus TaxID=7782 RepID=UPI002457C631|nr:transmembrane protein 8B [Leucoraja erinacea]